MVLLTVSVLPSKIVRVDPVAGAVKVSLLTVVKTPAAAVVTPIEVLLMVLAAVGLMVRAPTGEMATVPVPVGESEMAALAPFAVKALLAVKVPENVAA